MKRRVDEDETTKHSRLWARAQTVAEGKRSVEDHDGAEVQKDHQPKTISEVSFVC